MLSPVAAAHDTDGAAAGGSSRFAGGETDLRSRTARGTLVNGSFLAAMNGLGLVKGVAVAGLLTTAQYGTWGLLMAAFMTILTLGSVGVDDKYVQQDDADQRRAFEIAFTFQVVIGVIFTGAILVGMPLFALLYGRDQMIGPGLAFALSMPALVLQMPLWVHYRRMDFVRQRSLQAIDPIVSFVAVIALAAAGLGLWALVGGELLGTWCAAVAIVRASPYRLALRWDRQALREYERFSWPLLVAAGGAVLIVQVPVAVAARVLGVGAVAGLTLAGSIAQFTTQVDSVVTESLYPAICAVRDRADLLFESFSKSNRLALLWAAPLGGAAALFAGPFVHFVIGERWRFATPLIVAFGVNAALNQIGFNWTAFFRALDDTRPIGVATTLQVVTILVIAVPLLVADGLTGYAIGVIASTALSVGLRLWYLRRLFPSLALLRHIAGGIGPALPPAAIVVGLRLLVPSDGSLLRAVAEVLLYTICVLGSTVALERPLLAESIGYLRGAATG